MKSLTLILFLCITLGYSNFIIFENIGKMATAITYINIKLTVNISEIEDMVRQYGNFIKLHHQQFITIANDKNQSSEIRDIARSGEQLLWQFTLDYHTLRDEVHLLKRLLPVPRIRDKRFIGLFGIGLGVMGTFMGLYNTAQLTTLQNRLDDLSNKQNKMVKVVMQVIKEQEKIADAMDSINTLVQAMNILNPSMLGVRFNRIDRILRSTIQRLFHTFQMAQSHRLSVDFNSADELQNIYNKLSAIAIKDKLTLLTEKPLDLFQIETSYFSDGSLLHLLLHVPAVSEGSLLNLLRMYPLPVPISPTTAIYPIIDDNVLGLSPGREQLVVHLSTTDLMDCKLLNKIYLCERHAVLHRQINDSCIGALYLQDFKSASALCPITAAPVTEIVRQLSDNWFIIFSPRPQTARISCTNGTLSQFYLPEGIARQHLSPGCRADFQNHVLLTDNSILIENDIQHFDWTWIKDLTQMGNFTQQLEEMHHLGLDHPTIDELVHFQSHSHGGIHKTWKWFLKITTAVIAICLTIFLLVCCTNKTVASKVLSYVIPQHNHDHNDGIELSENFISDAIRNLATRPPSQLH